VPATIHAFRSERDAAAAPAGWPQRWQKRARGDSSAWQLEQVRRPKLAPQALQKFPDAWTPHAGQVAEEGVVMEREA
jgi:hypothetical protein